MLFNIILFFFVVTCLVMLLRESQTWTMEGFDSPPSFPVSSHNEFVQASKDKFNKMTNTINLPDPAVPITNAGSKDMKEATGNVILKPTSSTFDLSIQTQNPLPEELPDALELAKKCEAAANTCDAFNDPTFQKYCGMSFDKDAVGSDGKPRSGGGMFVSPTDRSAHLTRFREVKEKGMEPYDPYKVAKPTIGQSKSGTFALTKDQCVVVKEKVDCETKQTFNSPNCAQCYTSRYFSRVDPQTTRIGATMFLSGNGAANITSTHNGIRMEEKSLSRNSTVELAIPGDAEGATIDITVKKATSPPTFVSGYLQAETARGVFKIDINRMVQSDKVTNRKPRLSGTTSVNGFRCVSMIPGAGKATMTLSLLVPFSFINMYESDALSCDNGPLITKESSAIFLESDPCFSKDSRPGNYKLECLQDRWVSLGGDQKGTGYPSDQAKANALQKSNGKDLDIDTIIEMIAVRMARAVTGKDAAGKPLSIPQWNEDSMWGLGIPINSPCDGIENQSGTLTRECLSYLYMNKGAHSHIGPTYTLPPNESASMKDQTIHNTYCQPGTELDPATDAGLAFANTVGGGIDGIKKKYDEIHRTANDNGIPNQQRADAVKKCYGVQIKPVVANKVAGPKQVFAVGPDYRYRRDEAQAVCAKYGAQVATKAQLEEAQRNGADWCFSAWLADSPHGSWPISLTPVRGCGDRRGIIEWTPDSQKAGVNCYGSKPVQADVPVPNEILPFNGNVWDQPTEPTYFRVTGGYLETSDLQPACFNGLSPQQAMENCNNLGSQCAGFSYSIDGGGHGCYKGNVEGGKVMDANYVGYVKSSMSPAGNVSGRYIKLQHQSVICMNLAQIYVLSEKGGKNIITPNTTVSKSSVFGADHFPNRNFVDGVGNTIIHTSCGDIPWIEVDLGRTVPLYKIVIRNRSDCCQDRAQGITIQVLDESKTIVYASRPIRSTNMMYAVYPPSPEVKVDQKEDMDLLPKNGPWKCLSPYTTPARKNAAGDVECMSWNNRDCMWMGSDAACNSTLTQHKDNPGVRPLICGEMHRQQWGGTGYDNPNHWCAQLKPRL
jgi:hypothetical protein